MTAGTTDDMTRTQGRSAWKLLALMLAAFFALCAATLALPHNGYIRYQQLLPTIQFRAVWGFERGTFDETPIDIAIIGNSRLAAAVSAPKLEDQLSAQLGRPVHVANLSMPQEGRNVHYVIARRLLETHPEVKLVILSVVEQMPREGHPAFRDLADAQDVLSAPILFNTSYFTDLAYLPFRQMSLFTQTLMPRAFGVNPGFVEATYAGPRFDSTGSYPLPTGGYVERNRIVPETDLLPGATFRAQSITPSILPEWAADREFVMDRYYTEQIASIAQAKGADVAFLYTPIFRYAMGVREDQYYATFGAVIEANFLAEDARNFADYGHTNYIGSDRLTRWLGQYFVDQGVYAPSTGAEGGN